MGLLSSIFGSSSRSSTTETSTTNNYTDSRQVHDASGGGQAGSNNQWQQLVTTENTHNWDASQTWVDSGDKSTNWTDNSDRSSSFQGVDKSNRSTNYTSNVLDGGAIGGITAMGLAQTDAAKAISMRAFDTADRGVVAAANAQTNAMEAFDSLAAKALGLVQSNSAASFKSSADALGFQMQGFGEMAKLSKDLIGAATKQTEQAAGQAQAAFNTAADQTTGNRTLILAALAAVAVVAFTAFKGR